MWDMLREWFFGLGAQYGVNPVIFGSIYVGAIPFFTLSVAWIVRNLRRGKSVALPSFCAAFCALSAYLYLLIVGENLPAWVYVAVAALVAFGAYSTVQKIRARAAAESLERDAPGGAQEEAAPRR